MRQGVFLEGAIGSLKREGCQAFGGWGLQLF